MCRESAGISEASHRVRLQVHPVQTTSKGKSGQDSSTPTARPHKELLDAAREQLRLQAIG
jgi:hypothetical protein